jgi:hypothetical protein
VVRESRVSKQMIILRMIFLLIQID